MKVQPVYDPAGFAPASAHWVHFSGQAAAQPVALWLDLTTGMLMVGVDYHIGGDVDEGVRSGRVLNFALHAIPTPAGATALINRAAPMAQAVLDDDGNTQHSPRSALRDYIDSGAGLNDHDIVAVWPDDAITSDWVADEDITARTTNKELEGIATRILAGLAAKNGHGAAVCAGLVDWLEQHRDQLAAESESDAVEAI